MGCSLLRLDPGGKFNTSMAGWKKNNNKNTRWRMFRGFGYSKQTVTCDKWKGLVWQSHRLLSLWICLPAAPSVCWCAALDASAPPPAGCSAAADKKPKKTKQNKKNIMYLFSKGNRCRGLSNEVVKWLQFNSPWLVHISACPEAWPHVRPSLLAAPVRQKVLVPPLISRWPHPCMWVFLKNFFPSFQLKKKKKKMFLHINSISKN